jgi:putative endonuclease
MDKRYYVYIMTNKYNNVLYTGVTNDLGRRARQHKLQEIAGFTSKYKVNKLVYFEAFESINEDIAREKQIKGGSRKKKQRLIDSTNIDWFDLTYSI